MLRGHGSFATGQTATWQIPRTTFAGYVGSSSYYGFVLAGASGTTAHFRNTTPTLTGSIIASALEVTGATDWSAATWDDGALTLTVGSGTVSGGSVSMGNNVKLVVTNDATLGSGSFNGTFDIATGGQLVIGTTADQALGGAISGTGALVKREASVLSLNASSTFSGGITVAGGTLNLPGGDWVTGNPWGAGGMTGGITVGSGATLSTSEGVTQLKNPLVLNGGTVSSRGNAYPGEGWGNIVLSTSINAAADQTSLITSELRLRDGDRTIDVGANGLLNLTGSVRNLPDGSGGITKTGSGTLTLNGPATYTGNTTVNAGTLNVLATNTIGTVTINGGSTVFPSGSSTALNGDLNLLADNSGSGVVFSGGTVVFGQLYSWVTDGLQFTISGTADVTAAGGVYCASWRGASGMYLNGGTLRTPWIAGNASTTYWLNDNAYIHFNGTRIVATADSPSFIRLQGGANYGNENFARLGSSTSTTFDTAGYAIGIGVTLDGAGSLVKAGAGTLTLSGANTYGGGTTIEAGTLELLPGAVAGSGTVTLDGDATLAINDLTVNNAIVLAGGTNTLHTPAMGAAVTLVGSVTSSGTLRKTGAGQLTLSASGSRSGDTIVEDGTLVTSAANGLGTNDLTVASGTGVTLGGSQQIATLSGLGTVTATAGTLSVQTVVPATEGTIGTLTIPGGSVVGALKLDVSATNNVCDKVVVDGAINLAGATLDVTALDRLPTANTYVLLTAPGGISGKPTANLPYAWQLSIRGNDLVLVIQGTTLRLY